MYRWWSDCGRPGPLLNYFIRPRRQWRRDRAAIRRAQDGGSQVFKLRFGSRGRCRRERLVALGAFDAATSVLIGNAGVVTAGRAGNHEHGGTFLGLPASGIVDK